MRVLLGCALTASGTACIDQSLAAGAGLQPQPRQSILVLETDGAAPSPGALVTVRGRLLRGTQVEPVGAYTVRLQYDTSRLAIAPGAAEGIDLAAFGERMVTVAAPAVGTGDSQEVPVPQRSARLARAKGYPTRTAKRLGADTASLHVVHEREAQRLQRVEPTAARAVTPGSTPSRTVVSVPEGMRAMRVVRPGELRVATVVPDGMRGDVLFEVQFRAQHADALTTIRLDLDELVGVRFEDQRPFTRVEPRVTRRGQP